MQHLGTAPEATPSHSAQIIRKLGLAAGEIQPDMTLEEPWDFLKDHVAGQLIALLLPEIQWTRSFARALSARANYRIATGDIELPFLKGLLNGTAAERQ